MKTILYLALPLAALCGCQTPSKPVVYSNTNLEIDQPIEQLETVLTSMEAQQDRNYTIANISFLYGIKLHLIFEEYLASLSADQQSVAIADQKKWQVEHDKKVSIAYAEYEGGTYAGFNTGEAAVKSYKARIAQIEARCPPKMRSCLTD